MKNKLYLILPLTLILISITLRQGAAQQTEMGISPQNQTIPEAGLSFTINVTIQNVNDLYGWELKLYYPNAILNGTGVTEGPMLKTGGALTFFIKHLFKDAYNETHGIINLVCLRVEADLPGVNGNGVLATITFKTTSTGNAVLHLDDVKLSDSNATPIPHTITDGTVIVIPEFPSAIILPTLILLATAIALLGKTLQKSARQNPPTQRFLTQTPKHALYR